MDANNKGKPIFKESSESNYVSKGFPAGLRILVVDDDRTCLLILEKMLQNCLYKVTKCQHAKDALSMLRQDKSRFDIVVSDLHMPDMDGFQLLEIVGIEMGLPVVMMSSDDEQEVVLKGVLHGACDYLIKPIRMDALKIIWQHVLRKRRSALRELEQQKSVENAMLRLIKPHRADHIVTRDMENTKSLKRRRDDDEDKASGDATIAKKRMVWTKELHGKFVQAVDYLGNQNAVPMKILECMKRMNVPAITRENIASHLQKYRMHLRGQDDIHRQKSEHFEPSRVPRTSIFWQSPSLTGRNLQFCATANQLSLQSLTCSQQSSRPVTPITNSGIGLPFDGQSNLLHSRIPQLNSYPLAKSSALELPLNSTFGVSTSCKNMSSVGIPALSEGYEHRNQENIAQHSQNLQVGGSCESKDDTTPQLIDDPSLFLQHFDHDELFCGLFMEEDVAPHAIEYKSNK